MILISDSILTVKNSQLKLEIDVPFHDKISTLILIRNFDHNVNRNKCETRAVLPGTNLNFPKFETDRPRHKQISPIDFESKRKQNVQKVQIYEQNIK